MIYLKFMVVNHSCMSSMTFCCTGLKLPGYTFCCGYKERTTSNPYISLPHIRKASLQYFAVKAVKFSSPSLHQIFFVLRVKRSYFCSWWREVWYLEYHLGGSTGVCTGHCFLPAPQVGSRFGQMWPRQGLLVGVCGGGCDHCSDVSTQTAVDIIHS